MGDAMGHTSAQVHHGCFRAEGNIGADAAAGAHKLGAQAAEGEEVWNIIAVQVAHDQGHPCARGCRRPELHLQAPIQNMTNSAYLPRIGVIWVQRQEDCKFMSFPSFDRGRKFAGWFYMFEVHSAASLTSPLAKVTRMTL